MHCHGFFKGLLFTVIDAPVACVDICEVLPILYYVTCDCCVYERSCVHEAVLKFLTKLLCLPTSSTAYGGNNSSACLWK